ncbi:MAG TPA: phosphate ABC transporter permease subunit PstC [Chloroflexi bacterium]|nr:phosphate ABC transporter permease subunit PstC [Chloroflexota bacterium]
MGQQSNLKRFWRHGDALWEALLVALALAFLVLVLHIGWMLWQDSELSRRAFGWRFLIPTAISHWNPAKGLFQAWPSIYGTLVTSLVAIVLAVPISIGIAIFLAEICPPWLRLPLNYLVEMLAAVPSVVYGLWGIFVFLPTVAVSAGNFLAATLGKVPGLMALFHGPIPTSGLSRLGASFILTIMIIPTIAAVSRDVFLAIPREQREAALALGATHWEVIWDVLIPYGASGFLGAIILGLGRALGETMAVTMVIGNSVEGSYSLLRPGYTMASIIANEFAEAVKALHSSALMEIGLILFGITLLVNVMARILVWRVSSRVPGR